MALEMKATSRWWYARFLVKGKLRRFPLMEKKGGKERRLDIKGRRPPSLKHPEKGDSIFLESYHRAMAVHDRLLEENLSKSSVGAVRTWPSPALVATRHWMRGNARTERQSRPARNFVVPQNWKR